MRVIKWPFVEQSKPGYSSKRQSPWHRNERESLKPGPETPFLSVATAVSIWPRYPWDAIDPSYNWLPVVQSVATNVPVLQKIDSPNGTVEGGRNGEENIEGSTRRQWLKSCGANTLPALYAHRGPVNRAKWAED
jgi:hypothetical protein